MYLRGFCFCIISFGMIAVVNLPFIMGYRVLLFLFMYVYRYVVTLRGRKRFLTKIKLGNSKEKSKAQRQAVNSICQVIYILSLSLSFSLIVL